PAPRLGRRGPRLATACSTDHERPAELRVMDRTGPEQGPRVEPRVDASEALASKLRTLIQLIELISSSLDTDEILRQIAAAAVRLTDRSEERRVGKEETARR